MVTSVTLLDDIVPKVFCFSFINIPTFPFVGEGVMRDFEPTHTLVHPAVPKGDEGIVSVLKIKATLHFSTDSREIDSFIFIHKPKVVLRLRMSRAL